MPPKRKTREKPAVAVKVEESPSVSNVDSDEEFSSVDGIGLIDVARNLAQERGEFNEDEVVDLAGVYLTLPTETLLTIISGVCSRLQAVIAPLSMKHGMIGHGDGGERRLHQDALRVLVAARRSLTPAVNTLLAAEMALKDANDRHVTLLDELRGR
jgi:hypothetical protein